MSLSEHLSDHCVIQNRTVSAGKVDTEVFTAQILPTNCRVITQVNKRKTSPDGAEKIQYGTFVFLNVVLPKSANIKIHDRIQWPVTDGNVYDVAAVIPARNAKNTNHLVAVCDTRA